MEHQISYLIEFYESKITMSEEKNEKPVEIPGKTCDWNKIIFHNT